MLPRLLATELRTVPGKGAHNPDPMPTDTTELGLERLICAAMTGSPCDPEASPGDASIGGAPSDGRASPSQTREPRPIYDPGAPSGQPRGSGWTCGDSRDYEREHCVDVAQLAAFLSDTQPETAEALALRGTSPTRRKFLVRLRGQISKRGTIDVLRHGVRHGPREISLFYGTPSPGNEAAKTRYDANRFTVTRQLRYSRDQVGLALDLALFVNGLPVVTFELKNRLTKQTVHDAVRQYACDRSPRERLFELGRCVAHFAVDEQRVRFCTHLRGKDSWFLPFDRGHGGGAGNPPNPAGLRTAYLWEEVLSPDSLVGIVENYAQSLAEKDPRTGRRRRTQIWPRYHQLDVVRRLLDDALRHGPGRRYLIQHSAGSGKSNSIAWLAHQLIGLAKRSEPVFDAVVVVTDRRILDRQIRDTIKQFAQVGATVGHAMRSRDLRRFIEGGKKIVVSTVQKFPFILDEIREQKAGRTFAIVIDEAHSSQGGRQSGAMSQALSGSGGAVAEEDAAADDADVAADADVAGAVAAADADTDTLEDQINRIVESRRMLPNASYFAFTATPKNKTLELFGTPVPQPGDDPPKRRPFHAYTMKQAVQEGFILDVLQHYTPVRSYYRLVKSVEDDPLFDANRAAKKLRRYVEDHDHAIRLKAEIMADHFHNQVVAKRKIGGKARAMVVTSSVRRAIQYYDAVQAYLSARKRGYKALVAFSGEREHGSATVSEAALNGFPESQTADKFREDPHRILVCADKFQTGYDEPLLHTMYVDKPLSGVRAVQTLSRLNRACPGKHDVAVLDFANDEDAIKTAFEPYYQTTILSGETDPDRLHDLQSALDACQVYDPESVDEFVELYLGDAGRERLDPILDASVEAYVNDLDEDGQVEFKGKAKTFLRTYDFLSSILPYAYPPWEKRSIFLHFLVPRLPAPREEDLSRGILEAIDMDNYRIEKQAVRAIRMSEEEEEIDPVPVGGGGHARELELDMLSAIIAQFNERWGGDGQWRDEDRVRRLITEDLPSAVRADESFRNAQEHSDGQNVRIEHDKALKRAVNGTIEDDMQFFKRFSDDESFKRWVAESIFRLVSSSGGP